MRSIRDVRNPKRVSIAGPDIAPELFVRMLASKKSKVVSPAQSRQRARQYSLSVTGDRDFLFHALRSILGKRIRVVGVDAEHRETS